jgi:hypothetical protein
VPVAAGIAIFFKRKDILSLVKFSFCSNVIAYSKKRFVLN